MTLKLHKSYKKTVLAFSDSVIVNIPIRSKISDNEGIFDAMMSELHGMALAQGACVTSGLFMRGSVDLGWWYRRGSTLISQSMVRAYKTESKANVPVIALTDEIYQYFSEHRQRAYYSKDADPVPNLFRHYKGQGAKGDISFWYIDYITACIEDLDWITSHNQFESYKSAAPDDKQKIINDGYTANLGRWFKIHAGVIERAYEKSTVDCVRQKYKWLASYHNDVAARFKNHSTYLCNLN